MDKLDLATHRRNDQKSMRLRGHTTCQVLTEDLRPALMAKGQ